MDFLVSNNGVLQANGDVASLMLANNFNVNVLRPFYGANGVPLIMNATNDKALVTNAPATLLKDEWIHLDRAVIMAAKPRLKVFGDLRAAGLEYRIPNGMGKTVLEHQTAGDTTPATVSMDGITRGNADRMQVDIGSLPLPMIHKDFNYTARQIASARASGLPLDTSHAEEAGRQVMDEAERLTLGLGTYSYGGGAVYGYTNFPSRMTGALTLPTAEGWTGDTLVSEVIAMRQQSINAYHYGPWVLYVSTNWDQYLDQDYSAAKGDNTLRERLEKIRGINRVETVDFLTGYQAILVQQTSNVARAVIGMELVVVQWPSHGGMQVNFKVMAIFVPQLRADYNGRTGIVHRVGA